MRKTMKRSILGLCCVALCATGCGHTPDTERQAHYQRFVLVQVEQPAQGCGESLVVPCATVVLALDTKTGQVCRAAALHGQNYPLCLRLYEAYPDNTAEVERLRGQIEADMTGDWDAHPERGHGQYTLDDLGPCPPDDPLGLRSQQRCKPLPPKKGESK